MTPERWQIIRPILESALDLEPQQRPALLDTLCIDREVRLEVELLLAAHDRAGADVLQVAAPLRAAADSDVRFRLSIGKRIGAYKILEEIAVGGMGAVYRASRDDGNYDQEVAIKIVRTELGGDLGTARFKVERQILASLDHASIAKILDGGTTAEGIPYLVMELVTGLPITDYCDVHRLTVSARINLFRSVCAAVHYAHQRLVIHRDIKPSNILVTADGVPKLLDFGIAKIAEPRGSTKQDALTAAGTLVMTPEYASPEQMLGDEITTSTDIYSLGCVLYELLTGRRALRRNSRALHELARAVVETTPEKPSAAVCAEEATPGTAAEHRAADCEDVGRSRGESARKLQRRLRGDLDNIVMRAIRKEAAERYESVDQLSEDLRRHLHAEPVRARNSTPGYLLRKFVARNKVVVASAVAVFLAIGIGLISTLYQARLAHANEMRAERRFDEVRALANSLLFEVHDAIAQIPGAASVRKLLVERAQQHLEKLTLESESDAALLRELAAAYIRLASVEGNGRSVNVGDPAMALPNYRKGAELLERAALIEPGNRANTRALAASYIELSYGFAGVRDGIEASRYVHKSIAILESLTADAATSDEERHLLAKAYERTALLLNYDKDFDRSLDYLNKADAMYQRLLAAQPNDVKRLDEVSYSHKHIGSVLAVQGQLSAALDHYRAARTLDERLLELSPTDVNYRYGITYTYSDTGYILGRMGDIDGALGYYRKTLEIRSELLAADPLDSRSRSGVVSTLTKIADYLIRKGDYDGALDANRKVLSIRQDAADRDSSNPAFRTEVARAEQAIGSTYVAMAQRATETSGNRVKYCHESQAWNRRAVEIVSRQRDHRIATIDDNESKDLAASIARCDRILGGSNQSTWEHAAAQ